MIKENNIEKEATSNNEVKAKWEAPEVIDLDINHGTLNATSGPSFNDGGPSFSDYNS